MTSTTSTTIADTRPALVSRQVDFWMLGGASILFWGFCHVFEYLSPRFDTANGYLIQIPALFGFTTLLVNSPHFMASYHLAYSRGRRFVFAHWFQLIVVPLVLIALLVLGDVAFETSIESWRAPAMSFNYWLDPFGIFLVVGTYPSLGPEIMHHLTNIMYLTVGWHYTKQVFGCFMVYSRYDGYALSRGERNLLKASLLCIWGFNYFSLNSEMSQTQFFSMGTTTHVFPAAFTLMFEYVTVLLFVAVAWRIFYVRYRKTGELPPAPALVAWVAMFVWWMPFARSLTFFAFAVPFFHGLQYLPFYRKVIDARHNDPAVAGRSFWFYFAFLVVAGFIAFNVGPEAIDVMRDSDSRFHLTYWVAGVAVLINIHHFFIDNTIWRLRDENVRRWLLN